jgi:hypothetical protein
VKNTKFQAQQMKFIAFRGKEKQNGLYERGENKALLIAEKVFCEDREEKSVQIQIKAVTLRRFFL